MITILDKPITKKQLKLMLEEFDGYIKVVVDIKQRKIAGGCKLHVDCEKALLESGCSQEDLWGGGVDWQSKQTEFNSLTNIRPRQENPSQEILNLKTRSQFEKIVKKLFLL